jgi:cephalosporin hydroxylase
LTIARCAITTHRAIQKEGELAGFLAVLMELEPEVVVEIGADAGGTLYAWQQLPSVRRVIAIDLPSGPYSSGESRLNEHGCEVIYGNSHDPATVERLVDLLAGDRVDCLFIDGDHSYAGVKADWELYAPMVRLGGIVAFHDICPHTGIQIYWDGRPVDVDVDLFWRQLQLDSGHRGEEIVTYPGNWGGIGWRYVEGVSCTTEP